MAKLIFTRRLQASSIIESIVTMVLILSVFFIAMHFLASRSGMELRRAQASQALDAYIKNAFDRNDFSVKQTLISGWPVTTAQKACKDKKNMIQVTFTIYRKDAANTPVISRTFLVNSLQPSNYTEHVHRQIY